MLTSISLCGSMAAIGDADGTVSMTSLSRNLWDPSLQPKEKEIMGQIFDRETRREKLIYTNALQARKAAAKPQIKKEVDENKIAKKLEAELADIEEQFFNYVGEGDA